MSRTVVVQTVVVPADQLEAMLARAVAKAFADHQRDDGYLSARQAAKLVHRRFGDVLAALDGGRLRGKRRGNRWMIAPAAVRAWAERGAA